MDNEYAKIESQSLEPEEVNEEQAIQETISRFSNNKMANLGTKLLAGGMAAVQSVSATSIAALIGTVLGIGSIFGGSEMPVYIRDDVTAHNDYECIDNYNDVYNGLFGTLTEQPLAEYNSAILTRLKEINEWSKTYVGQSVTDSLVCDEQTCVYYGHTGCRDASHAVKQVSNGQSIYYGSGARIDLANVKRIHSFFREYGLTDVQIAAICGVMTVESHIDFTSVENYNIAGARYNLDPSATTAEYGFKPWAEGLGTSPITTATCIHQISANTQPGPEAVVDYGAYSDKYSSIWKLGIGLVGFTDGPGFQLNTYLRNYADYINDRVTLIQRLIEGCRGWQNDLRIRAASAYDAAYGAIGTDQRGTATHYLEPSTGWYWKEAFEKYEKAEKELKKAVDDYNEASKAYISAADYLRSGSWTYHNVREGASQGTVYEIVFTKHSIEKDKEEYIKILTNASSGSYVTICVPEELKKSDEYDEVSGYVEYVSHNDVDVIYPEFRPEYEEIDNGSLNTFSISACRCPPEPTEPDEGDYWESGDPQYDNPDNPDEITGWDDDWFDQAGYDAAMEDYDREYEKWKDADDEHTEIEDNISTANSLISKIKDCYKVVQEKKKTYDKVLEKFNSTAKEHAMSVVAFYNAIHDYYQAATVDMELAIRDASYNTDSIFNQMGLLTRAAYDYEFSTTIDNKAVAFKDIFDSLSGNEDADDPTVSELRLYYDLWQNYAKYETNLPQSGKYINWWTPEVQLLYLVGGSYNADLGRGIKIRDEYRLETNPDACPICSAQITEYDEGGVFFYNWMSSWSGSDYTGRDIATATERFFHEVISGGFDDGTLDLRTEYAYAYYYMFQYGTPYQQALSYTTVNSEANKIMDEMIAEGRWQTNTSNTLSDASMPHNDKWNDYQTASITHQWDIDTSTAMSYSILATLSQKQSVSKVNLLENIWNGCGYVNVIDNSTLANAALYLTDNPLIYGDKDNEYYIMQYGDGNNEAAQPVSSLYKVVYNVINKRLEENGKQTMGSEGMMTDGFTFVKTAVLWSGLDKEFENIQNAEQLQDYLREATSSIWQDSESYQASKNVGRGNTRIWEQRKLGPYYDSNGSPYYEYKWYLVPRVLDESTSNTDTKWYDDIRNDDNANATNGDLYEDLDFWQEHRVDEHDTNNMPAVDKGYDTNGYSRPANENGKVADWSRVDWECWDESCPVCGGKGGHGDTSKLLPGDIIIGPTGVGMWLGESAVGAMYATTMLDDEMLVYVGGKDAQKIKSMENGIGFTWSAPCSSYTNHSTGCSVHNNDSTLSTSPEAADSSSCVPYNPDGKWTVYRLSVPNYTDDYRSAGVTYRTSGDDEYEIWYQYRYKGVYPSMYTKEYVQKLRDDLE